MGKHEAPEAKKSVARHAARHALHPVVHIVAPVSLHVLALLVIERRRCCTCLLIH